MEKGEDLYDRITENISNLEGRMVQGIPTEKLEQFLQVARQILDNLGGCVCKTAMVPGQKKTNWELEKEKRDSRDNRGRRDRKERVW